MKSLSRIFCGAAVLLSALPSATAQDFSIGWFSTEGGGGMSSAEGFLMQSSIGQPDAGILSGGAFALSGGFLAQFPGPSAGSFHSLRVTRSSADSIRLSWTLPASGYVLQRTTTLSSDPAALVWVDVPAPYEIKGDEISVVTPLPTQGGAQYYRLYKP